MEPEDADALLVAEYGRNAETYDRDVSPYYARIAERAIELAYAGPGESVIDLGCGTGNASLRAAAAVGDEGDTLGVDLGEGMVTVARRKAAELRLPNVRFEVMDVRSLHIKDDRFDAAVSCLALPTLGYRRAFREAMRVLHPGGRFVACDWAGPSRAGRALREAIGDEPLTVSSNEVRRLREARDVLRTTEDAKELRDPGAVLGVLNGIGARGTKMWTEMVPALFPDAEAYLAYSAAWRDSDFSNVDPSTRGSILRRFQDAMQDLVTPEGLVVPWELRFWFARK